jgi:hypothetical protein
MSLVAFSWLVLEIMKKYAVNLSAARWASYCFLFGTTAASSLPVILYDHDFPYVFNIYADSLIGLAGFAIALISFDDEVSLTRRFACMFVTSTAWMSSAELNAVVTLLVLISWLAGRTLRLVGLPPYRDIFVIAIAIGGGAAVGTLAGGVFLSHLGLLKTEQGQVGVDAGAQALQNSTLQLLSPASAYRPLIVRGVWLDFGNFPIEPASVGGMNTTDRPLYNSDVYKQYVSDTDPLRSSRLLFLFETRLLAYIKYLFFPLMGIVLICARVPRWLLSPVLPTRGESGSESPMSRCATPLALATLACFGLVEAGLVAANMGEGGSVYWKWALTRVSVPGVALAMFCFITLLLEWGHARQSRLIYVRALLFALTVPSWYRIYFDFFLRIA